MRRAVTSVICSSSRVATALVARGGLLVPTSNSLNTVACTTTQQQVCILSQQLRQASSYSNESASGIAPASSLEEASGEDSYDENENSALSTDLNETDDDFDYVEASCQELHDLTMSMVTHLTNLGGPRRMYDSRGSDATFGIARQTRGVHYRYGVVEAAVEGQQRFAEDFSRLMQHLTQDVFNRMHASSVKYSSNRHQSSLKGRFSHSEKVPATLWTGTDYPTYFSHAPHELIRLRSDMPAFVIENARSVRDEKTMANLKRLTKHNHEHRHALEARLFSLIEKAPVVDVTKMNRTSGLNKAYSEEGEE